LHQAILSILDMALRFREVIAVDAGRPSTMPQASSKIRPRLHRGWQKQHERRSTTGFAETSREVTQSSDSESEFEEEGLGNRPSGSHYYRVPSLPRDNQQLFDNICKMQDELDKLVRFIHREVEGLAGSTSTFSVFAFALEDWDR
jgi:hypothetical protein